MPVVYCRTCGKAMQISHADTDFFCPSCQTKQPILTPATQNINETLYTNAVAAMKAAKAEDDYRRAAKSFAQIASYQDAKEKEKECLKKAPYISMQPVAPIAPLL